MAAEFPVTLPSIARVSPTDYMNDPGKEADVLHNKLADEVEALAAAVGVTGSAVAGTVEARINELQRSTSPAVDDSTTEWWCYPTASRRGDMVFVGSISSAGHVRVHAWETNRRYTDYFVTVGSATVDDHNCPAVWADDTSEHGIVAWTNHDSNNYVNIRAFSCAHVGVLGPLLRVDIGKSATYTQIHKVGSNYWIFTRGGITEWGVIIISVSGLVVSVLDAYQPVFSATDQTYIMTSPADGGGIIGAICSNPASGTTHAIYRLKFADDGAITSPDDASISDNCITPSSLPLTITTVNPYVAPVRVAATNTRRLFDVSPIGEIAWAEWDTSSPDDATLRVSQDNDNGTQVAISGNTGRVTAPYRAAFASGSLDLFMMLDLSAPNNSTYERIIQRMLSAGDQRSWAVSYIASTRVLTLKGYADGTSSSLARTCTLPAGATGFRISSVAGGVTFYATTTPFVSGMDITTDATWTQVTTASALTLFAAATADIAIGDLGVGTIYGYRTGISAVVVKNNVAGSVVASMDFSQWPAGGGLTKTDDQANVWTISGAAYISRNGESLGAAGPRFGDTAARNYLNGQRFAGIGTVYLARSAAGVDTVEQWAKVNGEWEILQTLKTVFGVRLVRPCRAGPFVFWLEVEDYNGYTDYITHIRSVVAP